MPRVAKRTVVISVRVTVNEERAFREFAKAQELTLGVLIRRGLKLQMARAEKKAG